MHYRSVEDLNRAIVAKLHLLPRDLELVVGIPRSGLLAANLVALHLNLPLADLDGYLEGRLLSCGGRLQQQLKSRKAPASCKALVLDDSVQTGNAMRKVKERIETAGLAQRVRYGCVFVDPTALRTVDLFFEVCPMPRVFEWNLMHHPLLVKACVDIDGVICRDPSGEENDDGPQYERFLTEVKPLVVPTVSLGWLVTCRLERYRALTVAWLARHGIRYQELVMMKYPTKAARLASGSHGAFKADVYRKTDALLFIESSLVQATDIARLTGRGVFCMETREMINPDSLAKVRRAVCEPHAMVRPAVRRWVLRVRSRLKLRTRVRCMLAGLRRE